MVYLLVGLVVLSVLFAVLAVRRCYTSTGFAILSDACSDLVHILFFWLVLFED